jgi:putative ABC transport system substrate-binding protein
MRRREFIAGLGAAASSAIWPRAVRAQQPGRMRRVGVLIPFDENDPVAKDRLAWFTQGLAGLGWTEGRNVRLDVRYAAGNVGRMRNLAKELVDLQPDVIVVNGGVPTKAAQQQTRTIPIIFVQAGDAIANGLVSNIARPEGNTTGITNNFLSFGGKWLELLKEAAPRIAKVALVYNPELGFEAYFPSIDAAAAQHHVTTIRTPVRNSEEIERALDALAAEPNGGLVAVPPLFLDVERELMNRLAIRHRLPSIHSDRSAIAEGGLMSYAPDTAELYRRGGLSYVDRILRGAKVSELPVQFPTKFELVINLKTAKAMGLEIPPLMLARADEVIE